MSGFRLKLGRKLAGFTVAEIVVAIVIVVILIGMVLALYRRAVVKSEDTEAVTNLKAISTAEETVLVEEGTYVNASDKKEIQEKLEVALADKIFTYRVEEATKDSYVAIAERKKPIKEEPIIIALGPAGAPMYYYWGGAAGGGVSSGRSPWQGPGILSPGGGFGGYKSSSSGSSVSGIGSISGGYSGGDSSGGGSGGGSGSGSSGGSGGGVGGKPGPISEDTEEPPGSTTGIRCGDGICGGTESCVSCEADCGECPETGGGAIVDAALMDAYNALKNSSNGGALGTLLDNYNVIIALGDAAHYGAIAYWDPSENTIVVDRDYANDWTTGAIASVIGHEALHADFTYNPDYWISETLTRHPELSESDLHIDQSDVSQYPWNSIDQEFNAFKKEALVWNELKDATNAELDYISWLLAQGEEVAKARIREVYGPLGLPEY